MPESFVNQYRDYFQREILKEHEYPIDEIEKAITIITNDGKCVFLKDNKTCAIYNDRPQLCRDFGHGIGAMECHRVAPS
jgi:Fe-S-cluster containining protein